MNTQPVEGVYFYEVRHIRSNREEGMRRRSANKHIHMCRLKTEKRRDEMRERVKTEVCGRHWSRQRVEVMAQEKREKRKKEAKLQTKPEEY